MAARATGRKEEGLLIRRLSAALAMIVASLLALGAASAAVASGGQVPPTSDPFYSYSGSLAHVAPGTVLRHRTVTVPVAGIPTSITATQLLYRTTGELGQPTVTVATVIRPTSQTGPTRIVSYQTAYDALGAQCDPSYTLHGGNPGYALGAAEEPLILGYMKAGDTVVVPDYEGEHLDWIAGQESGFGTLDGIKAAEHLLNLPAADTPVGMVGYSGGSIATEFASELAAKYAPGLDIVGAAEGGIPVDLFHNLAYINGSPVWSGVIPANFVGLSRAFDINLKKYLSPYGLKVTNQVKNQCITSFLGAYPGLTYQKLFKPQYRDIYKSALLVGVMDHLIMSRSGTPKSPLFIGVGDSDGTGDGVMVTADDEALAHTYCRRGVPVQLNIYSGLDHAGADGPFEVGAAAFLSQRLAGVPFNNGCASVGVGNSLAPVPGPPTVEFRNLGVNDRLGALVIKLWTSRGTLTRLAVTLSHDSKRVARVTVSRLTRSKRVVVLSQNGHRPEAGTYTLEVLQGPTALLDTNVRIG